MTPGIVLLLAMLVEGKNQNWVFMGTQYSVDNGNGFQPQNSTNLGVVSDYIRTNTPNVWRKVSRNFGQTIVKRSEPRDKAYYNDRLLDHACPMTIRSSGNLRHRVPDVIGIGFAKCGTGALAFLDCHPDITFRTTEPRFFSKEAMLDNILRAARTKDHLQLKHFRDMYSRTLPMASSSDILIEKSPQYAGGATSLRLKRAKAMKAINPNMKLIAFACDPSRRAFSQLKMKDRRSQFKTEKGVDVDECKACLKGSFENAIKHFTRTMELTRMKKEESGYAAYGTYLSSYLSEFKPSELHIADGENLLNNPNEEWGRILDFLGVEKQDFGFEVVEDKGFPCLDKPLPFCLNSSKGTSRKVDVFKEYPNETRTWMKTFTPSIRKSMKVFGQPVTNEFCRADTGRFDWTRKYVCPAH